MPRRDCAARDIYVSADKPWGLKATPDPSLPDDIGAQIGQMVQLEVQNAQRGAAQGAQQMPDPDAIKDRVAGLVASAKRAAIKKARIEADAAFLKLDDILTEGGFYDAMGEVLIDIPLFPFGCLKGPVVRIEPHVTWQNGKAVVINKPKMRWNRVSPYDVWWTPGVSDIADGAVIERTRVARSDLNQVLGLPGYNEAAVREVAVSINSTSTLVSVFQNARVVFGMTRCFGSPSNETMATSLGPGWTISRLSSASFGCVFSSNSAFSAGSSARTTLTTSASRLRDKSKAENLPGPSSSTKRPSRVRNARSSSLTTIVE